MSGRPPQTRVRIKVPRRTAKMIRPKNNQLLGSWWPRHAALSCETTPSPFRSSEATESFRDVFKITLSLLEASLTLSFPGVLLHLAFNRIVKPQNHDSTEIIHCWQQSNCNNVVIKCFRLQTCSCKTHTHVDFHPFSWAVSYSHRIQVWTEAKFSVWRVNTSENIVNARYP